MAEPGNAWKQARSRQEAAGLVFTKENPNTEDKSGVKVINMDRTPYARRENSPKPTSVPVVPRTETISQEKPKNFFQKAKERYHKSKEFLSGTVGRFVPENIVTLSKRGREIASEYFKNSSLYKKFEDKISNANKYLSGLSGESAKRITTKLKAVNLEISTREKSLRDKLTAAGIDEQTIQQSLKSSLKGLYAKREALSMKKSKYEGKQTAHEKKLSEIETNRSKRLAKAQEKAKEKIAVINQSLEAIQNELKVLVNKRTKLDISIQIIQNTLDEMGTMGRLFSDKGDKLFRERFKLGRLDKTLEKNFNNLLANIEVLNARKTAIEVSAGLITETGSKAPTPERKTTENTSLKTDRGEASPDSSETDFTNITNEPSTNLSNTKSVESVSKERQILTVDELVNYLTDWNFKFKSLATTDLSFGNFPKEMGFDKNTMTKEKLKLAFLYRLSETSDEKTILAAHKYIKEKLN
jgi:hypothetical protein